MANLAVVGAGVGGCSAAYFARKYLPINRLTIYEAQDRVGGRILTREKHGINFELGASFFNSTNQTIVEIVKAEKLKVRYAEERFDFAVWDASKLIFRSNKKPAITSLKILQQYKLSIIRTLFLLKKARSQVARLYEQERKNPANMENLFDLAGLKEWCSMTFEELLTEKGASRTFIDEVASPITRTIYSQNADIGGLAGISSLLGVYGAPIYRFDGGNSSFPTHLAEASNAEVKLQKKVALIEKTSHGYKVHAGDEAEIFDGVIIATPLELASIDLGGVAKLSGEPPLYQPVCTKIMRGILNPAYFGLNAATEPPSVILTTKDADPIKHCSIQKIGKSESLVTFSSTEPMEEEAFKGVFKKGLTPVLQHSWKAAYPIFKPINKIPPTRLDERLMYTGSVESAVSSMETAALSALNAVKMMKTDLA